MTFTKNPRRWRKVLMYIALSKLPFEQGPEQQEADDEERWADLAVIKGILFGTCLGAAIVALPTTAVMVMVQMIAVWAYQTSVLDALMWIGGGAIFGAVNGWLSSSICYSVAVARYSRYTLAQMYGIYLESLLIGAAAMVALPLFLAALDVLMAQFAPAWTLPRSIISALVWPVWSTWGVVTCARFFVVLNRVTERKARKIDAAQGTVAVGKPPRSRILFRRGRSVLRSLPEQGGTLHTRPLPPKW